MSYTVVWKPDAEAQLAPIWNDSADRAEIAAAANAIDRQLTKDPFQWSEDRAGSRRVTFVEPLVVIYEVRPDDMWVEVLQVLRYPRAEDHLQ